VGGNKRELDIDEYIFGILMIIFSFADNIYGYYQYVPIHIKSSFKKMIEISYYLNNKTYKTINFS
jgi:hypothetical protein